MKNPLVSEKEYIRRREICEPCEHRIHVSKYVFDKCGLCCCFLHLKAKWANSKCEARKWEVEKNNE